MDIEVGYATPQKQMLIHLSVADHATVEDIIAQSNLLNHFPDIDLTCYKIGIFGKIVPPSYVPVDGDRIEIYRPLTADPKQIRKTRINKGTTT